MRFPLSSGWLLLAASQLASAHSWIEELTLIGPNGSFVGTPGYARSNVQRTTSGFTDASMVNLIPPDGNRPVNDILPTDLICRSTQTSQTQTDGSPRLQAPAGAAIALRYQENGHVTLPQNQPGKPENRGTNYVYGTSQPSSDDALLAIHRQWTADGKGGDGRGILLSTLNFDDGQCFQGNNGPIGAQRAAEFHITSLWCQQDIALPSDLKVGSLYTLYWVWDWPTMPGTAGFPDGKQELYTTCMDIEIVANQSIAAVPAVDKSVIHYESGQDISNAAVSSQLAIITNPTVVQNPETIVFTADASGPASGQAASLSASPTAPDDSFLSEHDTTTTYVTSSFTVVPIPASTSVQLTAADGPQSTLTIYDIETEYVTMTVSNGKAQTGVARRAAPTHSKQHDAFQLRARIPLFSGGFHVHGADTGASAIMSYPGPTVHQSPRLIPSPMSMLTKPLPHKSFSNSLVHYHFVYNLPSYIGLINGSRSNGADDVNRLSLPLAPQLRNTLRIHTAHAFPSLFDRTSGCARNRSSGGVGDSPCAILRRKLRIAAYSDYLEQACVRDVERAVNAERAGLRDTCRRLKGGCEDVGRGWEVARGQDEGESEKVVLASRSRDMRSAAATSKAMKSRLKSWLDKVGEKADRVKEKADQVKMKCSEVT
ncbi:hypothetical protein DV736_g5408, partial [Chaetothyriales sp. CBS 134916]